MIRKVASFMSNISSEKKSFSEIRNTDNSVMITNYSAEAEFKKDAVFCIELLTSKSKVDIKSAVFRNVTGYLYNKGKI